MRNGMKKYKAKMDLVILILVAAIMLCSVLLLIFMAIDNTNSPAAATEWGFALFMLLVTAFCMQLFFSTYYVFNGDHLSIRSGMLYRKKIAIASIRQINATGTPIGSLALSADRLEIFYNKFDSVVISPKDKSKFIGDLIKLNPEIEVI